MKYSIIIPTHNRPKTLLKFKKQLRNLNDCEVLFVQNGSSPKNICLYKKTKLPKNFKLINADDGDTGAGNARNLGVRKSTGEYIFFIDDDDNFFEGFVEFLNNFKPKYEVERFSYLFGNSKMMPSRTKFVTKLSQFETVQVSTYLLKKDFLIENNITFPADIVHQDVHYQASIWKTGVRQHMNKKIVSMSYTTDNVSISRSEKNVPKEKASLDVFDLPAYSGCKIWKFKLMYSIKNRFVNKGMFTEGKIDANKFIKREFKAMEFTFKDFRQLPIYFKFVYVAWLLHIV